MRINPLIAGLIAAVLLIVAAPASADSGPIWKIVSVSEPTNLASNSPVSQVEALAVDATGGTFRVGIEGGGLSQSIPYGVPAAVVESELNEIFVSEFSGTGSVAVTASSSGVVTTYLVTFTGAAADKNMTLLGEQLTA